MIFNIKKDKNVLYYKAFSIFLSLRLRHTKAMADTLMEEDAATKVVMDMVLDMEQLLS